MKKSVLTMVGAVAVIFTVVSNASAYNLEGGKYSTTPYFQDFYTDAATSMNGVSFYRNILNGVDAWNQTVDTNVWMQQTTNATDSIMDFHLADLGDVNTYGSTTVYDGMTMVPFNSTTWDWSKTLINPNADWSSYDQGNTSLVVQEVASHEEGHALGLDHPTYWTTLNGTPCEQIMWPSPEPTNCEPAVITPTSDDISGVQALYGTGH